MADVKDLTFCQCTFHQGYRGQDRIANALEGLSDECRADQSARIAGTERYHSAAPALRNRQRHHVTDQIDDVLQVVGAAKPLDDIGAHLCAILVGEPDRTAYSGVK